MGPCVLVNSIFPNDSFEVIESKEIWIIPAWNTKGSTNTNIWKLIVSLEHEGGCEEGFFIVLDLSLNILLQRTKILVNGFIEGSRIYLTSSRNNDVVSYVVFGMEFLNLISCNRINIILNSVSGLTDEMILSYERFVL